MVDDRAWGLEEAALEGVGGDGGVAGQPGTEGGQQGLGQDGEDDVGVDVEVDGAGQGVGAEGADDLGQALFDGHAAVGEHPSRILAGGWVGDPVSHTAQRALAGPGARRFRRVVRSRSGCLVNRRMRAPHVRCCG